MGTHPTYSRSREIPISRADDDRAVQADLLRSGGVGPSDSELLNACRAGDEDAWKLLVQRYQRLVFSVALRNGVTREEAADITQMSFIALLESIGKLRDERRVSSWLISVACRLAWRQRRRNDRELLGIERVGWAEDPVDSWERVAVIHEGLQRLGPACRDLLLALYFDPAGPSYATVAKRLGRPIGSIGPMRARCLQCLRALLGEDVDA